jgi:hypothetical protein
MELVGYVLHAGNGGRELRGLLSTAMEGVSKSN